MLNEERHRGSRLAAITTAALLASLVFAPVRPAQAALRPAQASVPLFRDGDGIHVLSARQLDSRLTALTVATGALPGPAAVRILLPDGYADHPGRRYPVLYLLHGTGGGAADWTTDGDAEQITAGQPLIVVMPDIALNDDGGGWCANWPDGQYDWETFHIDQLIPWVDANLRTIPARAGRAIAGLSQGGFCSMSYAARHPDLFGTALSYSGTPDIWYGLPRVGAIAVINATEVGLDHVPPDTIFGDPLTDGSNWAAHDPATLAGNLRQTHLYLFAGDGLPGPLDPAPASSPSEIAAMAIEAAAGTDTAAFHQRLEDLGIASYYDAYGPGTHSWPYWQRDLRESIGPLMRDFADPASVRSPTPLFLSGTDHRGSLRPRLHRRVAGPARQRFLDLDMAELPGRFPLTPRFTSPN
jgi:S-formylglutathione hydrolase FrmB